MYRNEFITQQELHKLLDYNPETGIFIWKVREASNNYERSWNTRYAGKIAGSVWPDGYRYIRVNKIDYPAHRLAWFYTHENWPSNHLDHINRNRSLNSISNLREATTSENGRNHFKHCHNTSGTTGVHWHKQREKWQARVFIDRKSISLGLFTSFEEATKARKEAEYKYYGNFIPT